MLLSEILSFCGGIPHNLTGDPTISQISTDSRDIKSGSVFIAIKGEVFDGHRFVVSAIAQGAVCAVVSDVREEYAHLPFIQVPNTMQAHIDIGAGYRRKFSPKVVGVTGSVGKTTTKDMIAAVLSQKYNTLKTQGNFNNEIGLPKTLFALNKDHQAAVIEMGMSARGEIEALSKAVCPDVGVITNIGVSHLQNLGTRENILAAKLEILAGLKENGPLFLNMDNDLLQTVGRDTYKNICFYAADNHNADYYAKDIRENLFETQFTLCHGSEQVSVTIPCIGHHNVQNAVCAYAIGQYLGLNQEECLKGLLTYVPSGNRQRIFTSNGVTVMADCYNASPDSMRASLTTFASLPCKGKRVAVLGDMLELGQMEEPGHLQVGQLCAQLHLDELVCYGPRSVLYAQGADGAIVSHHFDQQDAVCDYLKKNVHEGDAVLFKASHSMKLEDIISKTYGECENR